MFCLIRHHLPVFAGSHVAQYATQSRQFECQAVLDALPTLHTRSTLCGPTDHRAALPLCISGSFSQPLHLPPTDPHRWEIVP